MTRKTLNFRNIGKVSLEMKLHSYNEFDMVKQESYTRNRIYLHWN